jgi:hypothetical protein
MIKSEYLDLQEHSKVVVEKQVGVPTYFSMHVLTAHAIVCRACPT